MVWVMDMVRVNLFRVQVRVRVRVRVKVRGTQYFGKTV